MVPTTAIPSGVPTHPAGTRAKVLAAAAEIFGSRGLDAPMAAVAAGAGVGVGSVYRAFPSKDDLVAAIVVEQMDALRLEVERDGEGSGGDALEVLLLRLVRRQARNDLVKAALATTAERPEVRTAVAEASLAWQELIDLARREGRVRADLTTSDLRLFFVATRAAEELGPAEGKRMVELMLPALGLRR